MNRYPITDEYPLQRPLREEDQILLDAIEETIPGAIGDENGCFVERLIPRRPAGTFGEVIVAAVFSSVGVQSRAYVDITRTGVLVGIDTRDTLFRNITDRKATYTMRTKPIYNDKSRDIKLEAANRIRLASEATADLQ